jgi:hypothetical protein
MIRKDFVFLQLRDYWGLILIIYVVLYVSQFENEIFDKLTIGIAGCE